MKNKKISPKVKILIIISGLTLGTILLLITYNVLTKYVFNNQKDNTSSTVKEETIANELYDYKITNKATNYEKELFKELETILSEDTIVYDNYASTLTKLFITDLFTLKNKKSSSDVRSSQYVYIDYQETFKLMVKESMYSNIELDLDGTREQKLPVVKNVIINSTTKDKFLYNNEVIDEEAYYIDTTIEYEEDLGYPKNYKVVLVKKDNQLQIVKAGV